MAREDLKNRIVTIETAYEFMLSYAARGTKAEGASPLRSHLEGTAAALDGMGDAVRAVVDAAGADGEAAATAGVGPFVDVVERDAAASLAAVGMVLARDAISSQLIDNLNASIHLRALLTDLFLLDEALELGVGETSPPAAFAPDARIAPDSTPALASGSVIVRKTRHRPAPSVRAAASSPGSTAAIAT